MGEIREGYISGDTNGKDCATVQADSHWFVTAEAWFESQAIPCEICGGQRDTGTGLSARIDLTISVLFHQLSKFMHSPIAHAI